MNRQIKKIVKSKKVERFLNDQRIVVFSVCLLIATTLWFLNALNKNYKTDLSYSVKYKSVPKNYVLKSNLPRKINLIVEGHGFSLLRHKLSFTAKPLILNVAEITKTNDSLKKNVIIKAPYIINAVSDQVRSKELTIIDVKPDNIQIELMNADGKIIKQENNLAAEKDTNSIKIVRKKVSARNSGTGIEKIESIKSKKAKLDNESKLKSFFNKLKKSSKELITPDKTDDDVEKYLEKQLMLPVTMRNKPENLSIKLFPSVVEANFIVAASQFDSIKAQDFTIWVDYNDIKEGNEMLQIEIENPSQKVNNITFSPKTVEYLIEK